MDNQVKTRHLDSSVNNVVKITEKPSPMQFEVNSLTLCIKIKITKQQKEIEKKNRPENKYYEIYENMIIKKKLRNKSKVI